MTGELTIEESSYAETVRIEPGMEAVALSNTLEIEVDSPTLINYLRTLEGIDQIKILTISYSSFLKDLKIIQAFPSLTIVRVGGYKIESLEGLEWFQHADLLVIRTEVNRRRVIRDLSLAPINRLDVQCARPEDIDGIGECHSLQQLDLSNSKDIDFSKWSELPLESLTLRRGTFNILKDLSQMRELRKLTILGCRNLEQFEGDNSGITWLWIDGCKKLDVRTLQAFRDVESIMFLGIPSLTIRLSELGMMKKLRSLWLINCKVQVELSDLKNQFPMLNELNIPAMSKDQTLELGRLNPDVTVKGK